MLTQFEHQRTGWEGVVVWKVLDVVRQLGVMETPGDVQQLIEMGQIRVVTNQPDKVAAPVAARAFSVRRLSDLAI